MVIIFFETSKLKIYWNPFDRLWKFVFKKILKNSDIKKIEISDDNVILTSRNYNIKIKCEKNDERIPPIEILIPMKRMNFQ